jgi:hypothetical protein
MADGFSARKHEHGNDDSDLYKSTSSTFNEREFILKLLSEKRVLLAALHSEKKERLKWKSEYEKLVEERGKLERDVHDDFTSTSGCSTRFSTLTLNEGTAHQNESKILHKRVSEQEKTIQLLRSQNESLLNQTAVLKSEVIRLAGSLSKLDIQLDAELLKEQLTLYEEDFRKEKDDKVNAQSKISTLNEQLRDCQEFISNLSVEIDMYKQAYEREKKEKEKMLLKSLQRDTRKTSENKRQNRPQPLPKPQLQVVYPVVNTQAQEDDTRRRQQLQRVGVFTRDMQRSPNYLYGSDVELDGGGRWWS